MKVMLAAVIALFPVLILANPYDDMASDLYKKLPKIERAKEIAVMPFSSQNANASDAIIATEEMTKAFTGVGANVTERSQIDKVIKEQELQLAGITSNESAAEVGKGVGAKYVVVGSVARLNRYGETGNEGIKVSARLVDISTFRVLAAASGEVSAADTTSKYRREKPREDAEYPSYLSVFGGMTMLEYSAKLSDSAVFGKKIKSQMEPGYLLGLSVAPRNSGFVASRYEFFMMRQRFDGYAGSDEELKSTLWNIAWMPMIRVPLWRYMEFLSSFTHLYAGIPVNLSYNQAEYYDSVLNKKRSSSGFGFGFHLAGGLSVALGDSVSLFAEYRYLPVQASWSVRSIKLNGDRYALGEDFHGHCVYAGLSLMP